MYVDASTVIQAASLIAAIAAIFGAVKSIVKAVELDKKQSAVIQEMQEEQTIICYGLKGALEGLIEQGCNGPCKEALTMLNKHLNKSAHKPEL